MKSMILLEESIWKTSMIMKFRIRKNERYMLSITEDRRLDIWKITLNIHQESKKIT